MVGGHIESTEIGAFVMMQAVELKATKLLHVGPCDNSAGNYPIAKKKQTLEALREKAHLRPRTNTIGAVARIRNALAFATHEFFQSAGFLYVHTPIITTSDCEGAGEMFQVQPFLKLNPFFPILDLHYLSVNWTPGSCRNQGLCVEA